MNGKTFFPAAKQSKLFTQCRFFFCRHIKWRHQSNMGGRSQGHFAAIMLLHIFFPYRCLLVDMAGCNYGYEIKHLIFCNPNVGAGVAKLSSGHRHHRQTFISCFTHCLHSKEIIVFRIRQCQLCLRGENFLLPERHMRFAHHYIITNWFSI